MSSASVTVRSALAVPPFTVAVIVVSPGRRVATGNSAPSEPAGMVTVSGTSATVGVLLARETGVGSVGAGETDTRRTPGVPLDSVTAVGVSAVTFGNGWRTCTVALTAAPVAAAEMTASPGARPVTANSALVRPAGTVTERGACSSVGALLVNATTVSAAWVALRRTVTLPVAASWSRNGLGTTQTT